MTMCCRGARRRGGVRRLYAETNSRTGYGTGARACRCRVPGRGRQTAEPVPGGKQDVGFFDHAVDPLEDLPFGGPGDVVLLAVAVKLIFT